MTGAGAAPAAEPRAAATLPLPNALADAIAAFEVLAVAALPFAVATAYFCAVEALQNGVRHAHARNAHIELDGTESTLTVTVTDDGAGFDPDGSLSGAGLTHMIDRADAAGRHPNRHLTTRTWHDRQAEPACQRAGRLRRLKSRVPKPRPRRTGQTTTWS